MDDWMPVVLPPEPCPRWLSPDRVLLDCRADVLASMRTGPVVRGADETGSIGPRQADPEQVPDPRRHAGPERIGEPEGRAERNGRPAREPTGPTRRPASRERKPA